MDLVPEFVNEKSLEYTAGVVRGKILEAIVGRSAAGLNSKECVAASAGLSKTSGTAALKPVEALCGKARMSQYFLMHCTIDTHSRNP